MLDWIFQWITKRIFQAKWRIILLSIQHRKAYTDVKCLNHYFNPLLPYVFICRYLFNCRKVRNPLSFIRMNKHRHFDAAAAI